jgi:hypothetical protein
MPRTIKTDISNLPNCIEDCRRAALDQEPGPGDPTEYFQLLGRLEASREKLPPLYQENVYRPYYSKLRELGWMQFNLILFFDPQRQGVAGLTLDIAQANLQNGEKYNEKETDGFQEVISDLYDGFLSAEDRTGVNPPEVSTIPPLAKWGRPQFGPYTWPPDAGSETFGIKSGIVNLPPSNARQGLLAWSTLPHETAGHDILHADKGLPEELANQVRGALEASNLGQGLPDYWASRIDETASDVLGILNAGPAAGIGLIGYLRALNAAYTKKAKLRNEGSTKDAHPADIVRGYLAAGTVRELSFGGATARTDAIAKETDADAENIVLAGANVTKEDARKSAEIVAQTLVHGKIAALENRALREIQDWKDTDEDIAAELRTVLGTAIELPAELAGGTYAAHVVAAAVMEAIAKDGQIPLIFNRMVSILKAMHDKNPSWGPLYVAHPGNITRRRAYVR